MLLNFNCRLLQLTSGFGLNPPPGSDMYAAHPVSVKIYRTHLNQTKRRQEPRE